MESGIAFLLKQAAACQGSPAHADAHCASARASGTLSPTYQRKGNMQIVKITKVQSRVLYFRNQGRIVVTIHWS